MALYRHEFAICPWCDGETGSRVDHLYNDHLPREAGPWYCDACGRSYLVKVLAPSVVEITKDEQSKRAFTRSMALLKLEGKEGPVFFVMDHKRYWNGPETDKANQEHQRFFFEEHSCPTNWLDECVAVIENGDSDPHGFLSFVRAVDVPQDFNEHDDDQWPILFPEAFNGETIDGELTPPMLTRSP